MATSRRTFIRNTTATAAAGLMPGFWEKLSAERPAFAIPAGFSLKILATNWGFQGSWDAFADRVKKDGYDGVEVWVPQEAADRDAFLAAMTKHGLEFGFLCGGWEADFDKHLAQFETALEKACALRPLYINCHSGRDHYTLEQNRQFIQKGLQWRQSSGVPVYHETHRGRILFAAHITRQYLEIFPELLLTLDISHWCNVHESLLHDQEENVALALSRSRHIHIRVGHAEGPQVSDPRAPEWATALQRHLAWWDKVVELRAGSGGALTMLTEFGPPDYLPALPWTRQPVANQWEINVHMKNLLRERYK